MKKYVIVLLVMVLACQAIGQVSVTFQLDLKQMVEEGTFSAERGDRVFLRGSFNQWKGTEFELKASEEPGQYRGVFAFEDTGDTISYKYVIQKNPDRIFWETNQNLGNRKLFVGNNDIILPPARFYYDEYFSYPVVFNVEKLREDYLQFRNILESTHPALYDFTDKQVLDSIFDSNFSLIDCDLDFTTFLLLMTEVISKVGCGHSSLWIPNKFWQVAPYKLFPMQLLILDNSLYVTGSYGKPQEIPPGSEILSINGKTVNEILKRLISLTSADGFNPSYRHEKVARNFSVKYAIAFGFPDEFNIEYRPPGTKEKYQKNLIPVSKGAIDEAKSSKSELSFEYLDEMSTGVLTINTFGYYGKVDMFRAFLDSVFFEIEKNGINNLILDVRGNSGGDPFCASYLWAYLEPKPLPYFKERYGKYDTLADPVPQPQYAFKGTLYTLIDGNGFSTTGHFCGLLKYHDVGVFIGSELGSTYTCTGNATYPPLKNTGIMVGTARVRRYTAAVENMDPKRGVMPEYHVEERVDDMIAGRDTVMEFALSLIKSEMDPPIE